MRKPQVHPFQHLPVHRDDAGIRLCREPRRHPAQSSAQGPEANIEEVRP